ncbi:CHAP domain-containing protein [Chitinophaga flava]|uniref:CHAP domain-containing protein n=1 Tax=Chitinophaga flava TaxID=2259036 RepID=A0A365XQY1_9BACT|nr:CHAP domain-containing protein [Chitinophaga flava]RBL88538.1 CHAP domain-containing protein [Chitinophaga flava]
MTLAEKVLAVALSQEGVEEHPRGSNAGPEVNQYLKSVGLGPGYPWCMAFVYWCMQQATTALGVKNELIKTGGVLLQWRTTGMKKVQSIKSVTPGAIFIMEYGNGFGHTGFVISVDGNKVYTIEGNTNDQGSREGFTVAKRTRLATSFKGFLIP